MAENDVLGFDALDVLLLLLAGLYVPVHVAVLGDGVSPEFGTAARFLAYFQLNAFLFLVFG